MTKNKTGPILESDIVRECCDYLHEAGFFFWRSNNVPVFARSNDGKMRYRAMPKYARKGLPDIMVISSGKLYGFEVKRKGGNILPQQREMMVDFERNGAKYFIVYDWTEVRDLLTYSKDAIRARFEQEKAEAEARKEAAKRPPVL